MKKVLSFLALALVLISISSCSEDENKTTETGSISLEFDARVGTQNLVLNTIDYSYENNLDQPFKVTRLEYYISNIRIKHADGSYYDDPLKDDGSKGYYLIDESDPSSTIITLENIPAGDYVGIEFTVGVDATKVSEGAQTGALDPVNGLFWNWNAGYVFVALEGISPVSTETDNVIMYHVGGYKSDPSIESLANNVKIKTLTFGGETVALNSTSEPEVHIIVDIKKFFEGSSDIDFSSVASVHSPVGGVAIANNYIETFIIDHIHQ